MKISLKVKLFFIMLELSLIPLFFVIGVARTNMSDVLQRSAIERLQVVADIQLLRVQEYLGQREDELFLLSSQQNLLVNLREYSASGDVAALNSATLFTEALSQDFEHLDHLTILAPDGKVLITTGTDEVGKSYARDDVFVNGKVEPHASMLAMNSENEPSLTMAAPLLLEDQFLGVIFAESSADYLYAIFSDYTGLGDSGEMLLGLQNDRGEAVFANPLRHDPTAALRLTVPLNNRSRALSRVLGGEEGVLLDAVDYRNVSVISVTRYLEDVDWGVVVKMDRDEIFSALRAFNDLLLFIALVTSLFILVVAYAVARSIAEPLVNLTRVAARMAEGDWSARSPITQDNEVGALAKTLNDMADKLEKSYGGLEQEVQKKTADLDRKVKELEGANKLMVGRELKMIELEAKLKTKK